MIRGGSSTSMKSDKVYNHVHISRKKAKQLTGIICSRAVRTKEGCMLYYSTRGEPTTKITVDGKRRQIARILYLSEFNSKLQQRHLMRRPICNNKHCIAPEHHKLPAAFTLKIYMTTFHPHTYKDVTQTLHIQLSEAADE